jgi:putative OPT family oligopeptide transporter
MAEATRRRGLSPKAYEEIPGEQYEPYIAPEVSMRAFTLRAIVLGSLFGIMFGAANAYLGLRVGLTVSTSIPIAVMSVAAFRMLQPVLGRTTILEMNISQTVGSASSSQASGIIFTIPALFLWGFSPGVAKLLVVALAGGMLGVLFMIPLRRFLVRNEHGKLPYPEGTASAEVLVAADAGGTHARNVFTGLGVGALYKWLMSGLNLWPRDAWAKVPLLPKGLIGVDVAPALIGVGYILGARIGLVMVGGSAIAWLIIIPIIELIGRGMTEPLYPETVRLITDMDPEMIWTRYIRYVGAGAVATAGIATLIRSTPMIISSFKEGMRGLRSRMEGSPAVVAIKRTDWDLPLKVVGIGVGIVVLFLAIVPQVFGFVEVFSIKILGALLVAIFAFFFVTVSSRIVGLVGVTSNPTSGMTIATLLGTSLVFVALGWTDATGKVAALSVGAVVAVAASVAGDMSQDLKTGFLLGQTPRYQQMGEMVGLLAAGFFICASVLALERAYHFGTAELPAPQANMMMLVIDGVLQAEIPWAFVLVGVGLALGVVALRIPALPFAVGLYLPITTMTPIFIGGMIRKILEGRQRSEQAKRDVREQGVLYASGLIGGDGLMGVAIAFWAGAVGIPRGLGHEWLGPLASGLALAMMVALAYLIVRAARYRAH